MRYIVVLFAAVVAGCASAKPVLYANEKYREVGREAAAQDVAVCRALADQAGATADTDRGGEVAKRAGVGAVGGAAAGAVGGAIAGNPGTGAAAGAASGVVWSLFSSMFDWMGPSEPSPAHQNYVNLCLADRDYQVAGWK